MEMKDIRKIIELMKKNELSEFEMEDQGFRISIKRGGDKDAPVVVSSGAAAPMMMSAPPAAVPAPAAGAADASGAAAPKDEDDGLIEIKSPIVGTFYRASSPDADPFVTVGDEVSDDSVVCIVEAMKVMNEIKAEVRGVIRKVLVENATPIEFGQPLFKVEPV